jgi:metallo-beta-lactamase family protein
MNITFYGAAQNVTGSKHLIESDGFKLLLDCGLYQGKRSESDEQNKKMPFNPVEIDAAILSHAHLDHCGTLPILVRDGFAGKIYCTKATAEIANYIMLDSADIQEHDAEYMNKHLQEGQAEIIPIYTEADVKKVVTRFEPVDYFRTTGKWTQLNPNIRFKFYDAGHILGSAVTLLEITEDGVTKTLAFTGDLGGGASQVLRAPETITENTDTLLSECTYGDRIHRPVTDAVQQLTDIITEGFKKKSKIIIPVFSLGRTQEIIYVLHKLFNEKVIPELPVYLDSPLAENITGVFTEFTGDFNSNFEKDFGNRGQDPFAMKNLVYIKTVDESKSLNEKPGPFIIISASGMMENGRVLHHLKNTIGDPNNIVLITGFQAVDTLGRKLQQGMKTVRIYGQEQDVKANIVTLDEFSAHADQLELLNYIKTIPQLQQIFLVHTEMPQATAFKKILATDLPSVAVTIPFMGQSVEL